MDHTNQMLSELRQHNQLQWLPFQFKKSLRQNPVANLSVATSYSPNGIRRSMEPQIKDPFLGNNGSIKQSPATTLHLNNLPPVICNYCRQVVPETCHYHRNLCQGGNFDDGLPWRDEEHFLEKMLQGGLMMMTSINRCHSKTKPLQGASREMKEMVIKL